jgi:nucleotide-binding universal stress UspA family protein
MRIIVATDGTPASLGAAAWVAANLHGHGGVDEEITVVHVARQVDEPLALAGGIEGPVTTPEEAETMRREIEVAASASLAATAHQFGERPVHEELLWSDDVIGALITYAADREADLLVVGDHGRGPIMRAVLGSVSSALVHKAPCPVLVVREQPRPEADR